MQHTQVYVYYLKAYYMNMYSGTIITAWKSVRRRHRENPHVSPLCHIVELIKDFVVKNLFVPPF